MEYQLRPAVIRDLDAVLKWISSAEELRIWGGPSLAFPPERAAIWIAIKADSTNTFSLVDQMDKVVGFGQILPKDFDGVHLARIIVSPNSRWHGLGKLLCLRLMEQARLHHHPEFFSLNVYSENILALRLYRSLGFVEVQSDQTAASILMKRLGTGEPDAGV